MAPDLAGSYNRLVQGVPYCYPVKPGTFADEVAGPESEDSDSAELHSQRALVAVADARILGFIHVGIRPPREREPGARNLGVIRFFWYEPGHRAAGQALLHAAEQYLRHHGVSRVQAFHQRYTYGFYQL